MGEATHISWCDHTWNPWEGCTRVSPGCAHCYAEARAVRFGTAKWGDAGTRRISRNEEPLKWDRKARADGVRRKVFSLSLGDWLERRPDLVQPRERMAAMIRACRDLDFLLLTKRIENIDLASEAFGRDVRKGGLPPNVWLGVTAEDQEHADRRIPTLLEIPAAVRFVSYEPALGAIDFRPWLGQGLGWIIVGGESGVKARPFDVAWARSTVRDCKAAGVACFVKQLGAMPREVIEWGGPPIPASALDSHLATGGSEPDDEIIPLRLRHKAGADPGEWPEDLRVQEMPVAKGVTP